ncbi:MAG: hypothetical protein M3510_08360 [Actinomycetota bacterium]|jgi:hypothetical protein|nr:hypothetical protein [Actinomycetota bacterium]
MKRLIAVAAAVLLSMFGLAVSAEAHPNGMCHKAGKSGVYVYLPPGEAANQHHRHLKSGTHPDDYPATAADAAHYASHGATGRHQGRKCISTPPGDRPPNRYDDHA